jgi:cobalt/nickel transport system permease protein
VARGGRGWVVVGLAISLIVVVLSPLASVYPDGLERVATDMGFEAFAANAPYQILPDYTIPFLGETAWSGIAAGIVGLLLVVGLTVLVAYLLRRRYRASA